MGATSPSIARVVDLTDSSTVGVNVRRASEVVYGYFSKLARATPYGTRVPLEVIKRR